MLMDYVRLFRTVWLAGRPGGGKTSLSIAMSLQLVAGGYADKICSNTPLRIGTLEGEIDAKGAQGLHDVVIILDEAWQHLGKGARLAERDAWFAYRRHHNQYLILPSVLDLCPMASNFIVERTMNWSPFGIPLWVYGYSLQSSKLKGKKGRRVGQADVGKYYWWHPSRVFPYYDNKYNPGEVYYVYSF